MKKAGFLLIVLLWVSCAEKQKVKIPVLGDKGITDVYNNSQIWLFFEVEKGDTIGKLNKNNKITDTHLFFNIDRRLPLDEVLPKVSAIKFDVENAKVHRSDGKRFFFSYADTVSKKFSLYDFTDTDYVFKSSQFDKKLNDSVKKYSILDLKKNTVLLNGSPVRIKEIKNRLLQDSLPKRLLIKVKSDVLFQDYLSFRSQLYHNGFAIENIEYIYSEE